MDTGALGTVGAADGERGRDGRPACEAAAYFRALEQAVQQAPHNSDHDLQVPGCPRIRLRIRGSGMGPAILPALDPILASPASVDVPDIEVRVGDERSTGVPIPPPPWRLREVITRGDVLATRGSHIRAQLDTGHRTVTIWDASRKLGLMWTADATRLPYWVRAAPLRSILHWALAAGNRHLLHAAAVGNEHAGALLVGPSGSGKSTTALACMLGGVGYVADDYILAQLDPAPRAVAVYGTAKIGEQSRLLLPALSGGGISVDGSAKGVVDVATQRPDLMRTSAAISAIVIPRVTAGPLALRRVGAIDALRALAPSTILQHAEESSSGMRLMSALVRQVPAFELELGADITVVAGAVGELLEELP